MQVMSRSIQSQVEMNTNKRSIKSLCFKSHSPHIKHTQGCRAGLAYLRVDGIDLVVEGDSEVAVGGWDHIGHNARGVLVQVIHGMWAAAVFHGLHTLLDPAPVHHYVITGIIQNKSL